MEVHFHRTGKRRYAVTIDRKNLPTLEMNPAPGYDPLIPHDLMHFVVESELGLRRGIFGQIASGGTAGTFYPVPSANKREASRQRRRTSKRGDKLLREGQSECALSERATYICWYEWLARSSDPGRRKLATSMAAQAKQIREGQPPREAKALDETRIRRVCRRLDDLSARWASLKVGESVTVGWPERN